MNSRVYAFVIGQDKQIHQPSVSLGKFERPWRQISSQRLISTAQKDLLLVLISNEKKPKWNSQPSPTVKLTKYFCNMANRQRINPAKSSFILHRLCHYNDLTWSRLLAPTRAVNHEVALAIFRKLPPAYWSVQQTLFFKRIHAFFISEFFINQCSSIEVQPWVDEC